MYHDADSSYVAIKALDRLTKVGHRARCCTAFGVDPESYIHSAIKAYFKWSMRDSKLYNREHIPILSITCATDRVHALGREYRDMWRLGKSNEAGVEYYCHELPTIFGIVIKYTVVQFITYDASCPGKVVRNMGTWDFARYGQEVWNALAVAEYMCCARNYLMGLDDEGLLGATIEEEFDDPDA